MKPIKCWHFALDDGRLGYDDGREIIAGEAITIEGKPVLCRHGLHGSRRIIDALGYAPGSRICRVEIWGDVAEGSDKLVGANRKTLWMVDGTDLLRDFARRCALDVIHLWGAPPIVLRYLKTGDESIRGAARDAARDAAWAAARAAARDAAMAAAMAAARDAAWAAAWAAARDAAMAAAREAAWDAAMDAENRRLTSMVIAEAKRQGVYR